MNVTAKDKGTGKEQSITISGSGNLDKAEVEKMAKEAEAHAEEDKNKRESVEARNVLESTIYQAEKMLSDYSDKMSEDDKKSLEGAIKDAKEISETSDKETIEASTKKINDVMMPIGAKMYESAEKAEDKTAENAEKADASKDSDEPVEGEVVDDKDKK